MTACVRLGSARCGVVWRWNAVLASQLDVAVTSLTGSLGMLLGGIHVHVAAGHRRRRRALRRGARRVGVVVVQQEYGGVVRALRVLLVGQLVAAVLRRRRRRAAVETDSQQRHTYMYCQTDSMLHVLRTNRILAVLVSLLVYY